MADHSLAPRHPVGLHAWFARFSDRRLVQLAARGSTPAFATIYRRHRGEIYRYCRSLLGNDDDAGDALQNTMLRALRGLEGERREIALRPWLFRIAHNEAISLMRVRGRTTGLASLDVAGLTESDDFETRERLEALIADIGELSEHQRSALIMRELSGLEFDEIAGALGTTPEAAKQAVYSARIALSELADGREMSCDEIRRKVSAEDRRILRARRVRAHLRACRECREFERAIADRSGSLGAFAPALAVPPAKAALEGTAPAPEGTPSGHGGTPPVQAGGPPG